jgi:hypothetical protein
MRWYDDFIVTHTNEREHTNTMNAYFYRITTAKLDDGRRKWYAAILKVNEDGEELSQVDSVEMPTSYGAQEIARNRIAMLHIRDQAAATHKQAEQDARNEETA